MEKGQVLIFFDFFVVEGSFIIGKNKNGNSLVSFGKAGWGTIIFCMAMFWFFVGFCTDGNNITAPAVAEHLGIQSGTVLQMILTVEFLVLSSTLHFPS